MVYNTENEASLHKLPHKSQISEKRWRIILLEIEKKESKTISAFQKLLKQISQSLSTIRAGRAGAVEEMLISKLPRTIIKFLISVKVVYIFFLSTGLMNELDLG